MFACLSNLKQRCRELYKEQTLFRSQVMKLCGTVSNMAHMSALKADSTLENFLSVLTEFQFHELIFGMTFLCIC